MLSSMMSNSFLLGQLLHITVFVVEGLMTSTSEYLFEITRKSAMTLFFSLLFMVDFPVKDNFTGVCRIFLYFSRRWAVSAI